MRIAMLTSVREKCGIASYSRALIEGLRSLPDMEVEVVPIVEGRQPSQHYADQAEVLNAPDVDCVHIQHEYSFWGSPLPRKWAYWDLRYRIRKPVVLTAHTTAPLNELLHVKTESRPLRKVLKGLLLLNRAYRDSVEAAPFVTAMTIVHDSPTRDQLIRRGVDPQYVKVVPSGIPGPLDAPAGGREFRAAHGLEGRRIITLFGFITPNKGYEVTLDVLVSLPDDVMFVIAGGIRTAEYQPYFERLKGRIREMGLDPRVVITGFLSDTEVAEAMAASDLVLVPHTEATNSYSVAIGLTYGKPMVASDLDTFREIRERSECMDLFRNGDTDDYRAKIVAVLDDPDRAALLAANAAGYAERFSWPHVAGLTRNVYQEAVAVYGRHRHGDLAQPAQPHA